MGKQGYFVLVLLVVFFVYGFVAEGETPETPESTEDATPSSYLDSLKYAQDKDDLSGLVQNTLLYEFKTDTEIQSQKVRILNWLGKNIDTMIFSKGVKREIEKVCFANNSDVYVWSRDIGRKEKWLISLHETASGLFPEFKAFFASANNTWKLESGEDTHKGTPLDCYLYDSQNVQWKKE